MRAGDLDDKPYARFWNPDMAPMQDHVRQALAHGIAAAELGFPLSEADRLLGPGHLPMETGFTRLNNGQVFVAVHSHMPGISAAMIDWWFGWAYKETHRFKLWHPKAHLSSRTKYPIADDPDFSDHQKYLGNSCYIAEYIGGELTNLVITYAEPSILLDVSRFNDAQISTAICGAMEYQNSPLSFGALIHLIRETSDGCEMRSRFWLGNVAIRRWSTRRALTAMANAEFSAKNAVPIELGREMVVHCAMQMNHLASFLADLYADYH